MLRSLVGSEMCIRDRFNDMAFKDPVTGFRPLDLVLVSEQDPKHDEQHTNHVLAVVDSLRAERGYGMVLRVYLAEDLRGRRFASYIAANNQKCWVTKLCNMVTIVRIYTALHTIQHFPLQDRITGVVCDEANQQTVSLVIPPLIQQLIEKDYNPSQQAAIHSALRGEGFTLIRGPPGTGKSHTIFGLFLALFNADKKTHGGKRRSSELAVRTAQERDSAMAHARLNMPWLQPEYVYDPLVDAQFCHSIYNPESGDLSGWDLSRSYKQQPVLRLKEQHVIAPKHLLFTAPSNAAVDEVVIRLMERGLPTAEGKIWHPKIVRLGPNAHKDVEKVTIEYLVQQALKTVGCDGADTRKLRVRILAQADMVCTTLSCCGQGALAEVPHGFDTVIIDEAAQAIELETLIPLKYGSVRCILLGDELQLPATVFSRLATAYKWQRSFFQRLVESQLNTPLMLTTQYRMQPAIALFPSHNFYGGKLQNDPSIETRTRRMIGEGVEAMPLAPFRFFNCDFYESRGESMSIYNEGEVEAILELFNKLVEYSGDPEIGSQVGVITLYMDQVQHLRAAFKAQGHRNVDISTVDGFQGREKEIIILSCVRGANAKSIGFLRDTKRINVAITRARDALYVVGCAKVLEGDQMWAKLIESARTRECFYELTEPDRPNKKRKGNSAAYMKPGLREITPEFVAQTVGEEVAMADALSEMEANVKDHPETGLESANAYHEDAETLELNRQYKNNQADEVDGEVEPTDLTQAKEVQPGAASEATAKTAQAKRTVSFQEGVQVDNNSRIPGTLKK
eukprot:TRINITY_DN4125_c0_g1_i5.p1 TRINITY_DN4125_c0_g1~~TRINITY_DN4125_c0_g1_i5.p1  ORF type:complete len:794 (+),score=211.44 TRINITY_DN4125_c0_g1_i5:153-2534(+)